jgi:hypothetical protein
MTDPTTVTALEELAATIGGYDDPRRASAEWKQVHKLLDKAGVPSGRATHVVGMRDLAALNEIIEQLRAPTGPADQPGEAPSDETLKKALKAFRKRLKLTVLDEESKLGHSPLSKGTDASNPSMVPPREWPDAVWRELARQGKLRDVGHGFYELGEH